METFGSENPYKTWQWGRRARVSPHRLSDGIIPLTLPSPQCKGPPPILTLVSVSKSMLTTIIVKRKE